jgi:hypothetical protein
MGQTAKGLGHNSDSTDIFFYDIKTNKHTDRLMKWQPCACSQGQKGGRIHDSPKPCGLVDAPWGFEVLAASYWRCPQAFSHVKVY